MRCYKCNSVLSDTDFCNSCGADVTIYKKIVRLSNTYYNMGLEKAKIRDLSGAADLLRRSVRVYKRNTKARNLLGLVYYEMGECVAAMSEWVISKNFQSEKNIADKYLSAIQSNPTRLDLINQTAKKFNTALTYANEGSDDLAIVQLKRILNIAPNYVKAAQLLALLYMKTDEYEKARRVLVKTEKIDANNTLTIKYLKEIDAKLSKDSGKNVSRIKQKEPDERPALSGDDVIIPQTGYREGNAAAVSIINVLVGIILGAALVFFLITPAREKSVRNEYNEMVNDYSEKIASGNIKVSSLEKQIAELESEKEQLQAKVDEQVNDVNKITIYDNLLNAASKFAAGDYVGCAQLISSLDTSSVTTAGFKSAYDSLKTGSYPQAAVYYFNEGSTYLDNKKYDEAVASLQKAYGYNSKDVRIVYNLAKAYRAKNNFKLDENAKKYFEEVIALDPESEYAGYAREFLS